MARLEITMNGEDYSLELEKITVLQAKVIKTSTGLTLKGLEDALEDIDPDALRALYWLMLVQSGRPIPIERVDFVVMDFAEALSKANDKAEEAAAEDTSPKEPAETPA